jgi:hypothetical protein
MTSLISENPKVSMLINGVMRAKHEETKHMVGRVLTVIDGAFEDPIRRKAIKDQLEDIMYNQSNKMNRRLGEVLVGVCGDKYAQDIREEIELASQKKVWVGK